MITISACSKKSDSNSTPIIPIVTKAPPAPYTIKEDFEQGVKTSYAIADVSLKTGSWSFEDALLGKLAADVKNDNQSVRLRTGKISMNFDIDSISMIKFSHAQYGNDAVSELSLWVSSDQGLTYSQLGNSINAASKTFATDSFKVTLQKKVRFQIRKVGTTRINIDDFIFVGAGNPNIVFNAIPDVDPTTPPYTSTPAPGRGTPSGTGTDVQPTTGDNSNLLFGNPSNALADVVMKENYLIDQKYYVQSYSSTRGTANWVSWHLDETSSTNATARLDNFGAFTGLPTGFYQVQSNSYSGSGFDRGHICPSADRTSSAEANSATFLMTNMIPQAPNNNQRTWANLENYLRAEVQKGNEVYIIMGSYGKGGSGSVGSAETINNGNITVPNRVWKVAVILTKGNGDLARVDANTRVLAVDTPNENTINSDWTTYITTVDAIEKATNYNLLSSLPVALQTTLQSKIYKP
ncbi:DNA/RNA non-specific endonuclease [Pedobacter cryophilus]|uniref:DNA/RNA non-specific endonuclease n=2 Tax=Pedobacter cryophilus TaxID=2571271 RepID=A0A4U1C0Y0_9SPHI|nr:DNA/RNA non-specific endonuclease [Pedobacter cryophilus]